MKYDFDTIISRRGTNSYKWDSLPADKDILPLWVADMDFKLPEEILDVFRKRVDHGIFGMLCCSFFSKSFIFTLLIR